MMTVFQEFTVPLNVVTKIIAEALPDDASVTVEQDYIKALARATQMFILYSTNQANQKASANNRRTVQSQDMLHGIAKVGFEHLTPKLIKWHATYLEEKEILKSKKKKNQEVEITRDQMEVEIITTEMNNTDESSRLQSSHTDSDNCG